MDHHIDTVVGELIQLYVERIMTAILELNLVVYVKKGTYFII